MIQSPRTPPQSVEIEQTVLGTMILSPKSVHKVMSILSVDDFYKQNHRDIFTAISSVYSSFGEIDFVSIVEELKRADKFDSVGGYPYLTTLTNVVPYGSAVGRHCLAIKDKAKSRFLISVATEAIDGCYEGQNVGEVLNHLSGAIVKASFEQANNTQDSASIVADVLADIKGRHNGTVDIYGIKTGLVDFDEMTGGLQKSDFIILAARPSMGKTTMAMNICTNAAKKGARGMIFSLEMEKSKLIKKQISSMSGVDIRAMDRGFLNDQTWPMVNNAAKFVSSLPIVVDDSSSLNIRQIQARAKIEAMKGGLDWIMVDYLQLAKASGTDGRTDEIREISAGLKAMAKDLKIPVLALSQLNRSLESRTDKRPMMSDLRESGALEQDADVIAFIYRDDAYNKDPGNPLKGTAELIISKNRCGPCGVVDLFFDPKTCEFKSAAKA